jgi:hypothetical protein
MNFPMPSGWNSIASLSSANSIHLRCVGCHIDTGSIAPSVIGGLIGGFTVLVGVLIADYLTRRREQCYRYDDAFNAMMASSRDVFFAPDDASTREIIHWCLRFKQDLGKIRREARWPLPRSKKISAEAKVCYERFDVVADAWRDYRTRPLLDDVLGSKLGVLSFRKAHWWHRYPKQSE